MDINAITTLITNVGFPIACVVGLAFFILKVYNQSVDREDRLYKELEASRKINDKAIDTIAHYAEKLEAIQTDISEIKTDIIVITEKIN